MAEILTGPFGTGMNEPERKNKLRPKLLLIGALVLCIALVVIIVLSRWTYNNYQVRFTDSNEYVLAYDYYSFGGNILKTASDSASWVSDRNEPYWSVSYDMTKPTAVISDNYAAIYDLNGTDIVLCGKDGPAARILTSSPILRAAVSENGYTAAITDDGTDAMIEFYDSSGNKIASVKTTVDSTGYPFDLAVSEDGSVLAVAFVTFEDAQMTSRIRFYNFTKAGNETDDNVISTYAYTGVLIPMLEYLGSDTFAGISTDSVYLYKGKEKPQEKKIIESSGKIISAFAEKGNIGYVAAEDTGNRLYVYSDSGRRKAAADVDIAYTAISTGGSDIVLYNRNQMAVYTMNGIRRYEGDTEELIRQITVLRSNRYIMITEEEFELITLS